MNLKEKTRSALRLVILAGILLSTTGCTMYGFTKVSEPAFAETVSRNVSLKDDILVYPDITVSVKPQNYYPSFGLVGFVIPVIPLPGSDTKIERQGLDFKLVVQMDAEIEGYTFAPSEVTVLYNGKEYHPTGILGPYADAGYAQETQAALPGHKWWCRSPAQEADSNIQPRQVRGKACFEITFPLATPRPQEEFQVILRGLERSGARLATPTLVFRPAMRGHLTLFM